MVGIDGGAHAARAYKDGSARSFAGATATRTGGAPRRAPRRGEGRVFDTCGVVYRGSGDDDVGLTVLRPPRQRGTGAIAVPRPRARGVACRGTRPWLASAPGLDVGEGSDDPCLDTARSVARVLVARGEAADALVCDAYTFGGSTTAHIDAVACNAIVPWIDVHRARRGDHRGAWRALVTDLHAEHESAKRACAATRRPERKAAASARYARARAALAAAREAGSERRPPAAGAGDGAQPVSRAYTSA